MNPRADCLKTLLNRIDKPLTRFIKKKRKDPNK